MNYQRLIIDGNNMMYRAFFTKRPEKMIDGRNITPTHQFLYMMKTLATRFSPDEIYLTWDKRINSNGVNFRKNLASYKEHRTDTQDTAKIFEHIDFIQEFVDALGVKTILPLNTEADDVIAFLAKMPYKNIIVSSDKDLLQLVSEDTHIFVPNKNQVMTVGNFEEHNDVRLQDFVLYKSIMGDVSDNVFGLEKYGPVRAKKLAEQFSADNILSHKNFIKKVDGKDATLPISEEQIGVILNNIHICDLSYVDIAAPDERISYQEQYDKVSYNSMDIDKVKYLFAQWGFHDFIREIGKWNRLFCKVSKEDNLLDCISM